MNKSELVDSIAEKSGLNKTQAAGSLFGYFNQT